MNRTASPSFLIRRKNHNIFQNKSLARAEQAKLKNSSLKKNISYIYSPKHQNITCMGTSMQFRIKGRDPPFPKHHHGNLLEFLE